jgi:single-stranded DNA-binding protein
VTIQGGLKVELYTAASDGKPKISRTVFADHVLALRQPPREKKPKAAPKAVLAPQGQAEQSIIPPSGESPTERAPSSFYDDDIPF